MHDLCCSHRAIANQSCPWEFAIALFASVSAALHNLTGTVPYRKAIHGGPSAGKAYHSLRHAGQIHPVLTDQFRTTNLEEILTETYPFKELQAPRRTQAPTVYGILAPRPQPCTASKYKSPQNSSRERGNMMIKVACAKALKKTTVWRGLDATTKPASATKHMHQKNQPDSCGAENEQPSSQEVVASHGETSDVSGTLHRPYVCVCTEADHATIGRTRKDNDAWLRH
ncbi:hypothetical protein AG1IA_05400 [Rhizoctonia solani AG-1 IA]|uniref:Uncharacterized protein n=1 Tax=Thanatephorus cucumeris (strain AG1-IA) TaxID=983506 RepID=L8WW33_THACA|nr:hypothetical protein AG1IA_05400 [Rhizoctonia solani AG-1 IA]